MAKKTEALEIPDIRRKLVSLAVQCGSCIFYRRMATYVRPCVDLGTVASSVPCRFFTPDPAQLADVDVQALGVLARVRNPAAVAATLMAAKRVRRLGFALGDTVYTRVLGGDYLCNYASGVVVGATSDQLVVRGAENYAALLFPTALLTRERWEKKASSLKERGCINDPAGGLQHVVVHGKMRLVSYEPQPLGGGKSKKRKGRSSRPAPRGGAVTTYIGGGQRR